MQVITIYLINLTIFLISPFSLLLVTLLCISYLDLLMSLTTTKNYGILIWRWRSSGLLSVVG